MKRKRYISVPVFRAIILTGLGIITAIWLRWLILDSGPYHWLRQHLLWWGARESQIVGATLAYLAIFIVWLIPTMVLRYFSDLPWLIGEEAQHDAPGPSFRQSLNAHRQRQQEMLERAPADPERRRFFRRMGWIGIGVGLLGFLATWLGWYLGGQLWAMPLAFGLVGVLGGLLSVVTGYPVILDWRKVQTIRGCVMRVLALLLVLILLFLAVMCMWQALR